VEKKKKENEGGKVLRLFLGIITKHETSNKRKGRGGLDKWETKMGYPGGREFKGRGWRTLTAMTLQREDGQKKLPNTKLKWMNLKASLEGITVSRFRRIINYGKYKKKGASRAGRGLKKVRSAVVPKQSVRKENWEGEKRGGLWKGQEKLIRKVET